MNNRTIEKRKIADDCELWLLWDDSEVKDVFNESNLIGCCYLHSTRVNKNVENNNNVLSDIFEL